MQILIDSPLVQSDLRFATPFVQKALEALKGSDDAAELKDAKLGKIAIDCAARPSELGLKDPKLYHARAVIYAWVEFCWDDIEPDASNILFAEDEPIGSAIDWLARKYNIQRRDPSIIPIEMMFQIFH